MRLAWHWLVLLAAVLNVRGPGKKVRDEARGRGREVYFKAPGSESEWAGRNAGVLSRDAGRDFTTARECLSLYLFVAQDKVISYPVGARRRKS